jgi:hypothetical protein
LSHSRGWGGIRPADLQENIYNPREKKKRRFDHQRRGMQSLETKVCPLIVTAVASRPQKWPLVGRASADNIKSAYCRKISFKNRKKQSSSLKK